MSVQPDGQVDCGELRRAAEDLIRVMYDPKITAEATFNSMPPRVFVALSGLRDEVEGRRANVVEVSSDGGFVVNDEPWPHLHVHVGLSQRPGTYKLTLMSVQHSPADDGVHFTTFGKLEEFGATARAMLSAVAEQRQRDAESPRPDAAA